MPPFFVNWLRSLSDQQAEAMWQYLDSTADHGDAIEIIAASHPLVEVKLCGDVREA